jgi:cytochrome c553
MTSRSLVAALALLAAAGSAQAQGLSFEDKLAACAACHGKDGNTPTIAEYPKLGGQYASYLENSLKSYRAGRRDNLIMSQQIQALQLSDEDIARLAAYYESQGGLVQISD